MLLSLRLPARPTARAIYSWNQRCLLSVNALPVDTDDTTEKEATTQVDTILPPVRDDILAKNLRPSDIVKELDRHIVGQQDAKRAIAIAMRNRWRRRQLPAELQKEVTPRNVLMIGPTGCGKVINCLFSSYLRFSCLPHTEYILAHLTGHVVQCSRFF
jgi:hypothetical protein